MRGFIFGLSISVAFIVGTLFASYFVKPAHAAPQKYTECFGAITWFNRGRDLNAGKLPKKMVKVPPGFHPIGGGGPADDGVEPYIIFCR